MAILKHNDMKEKQGWVSVDDRLPEYEREVVVLVQKPYYGKDEYMVAWGHRPNPNGYIITKTGEHLYAELYDEGGWNGPDIKYWLDLPMPNEQHENQGTMTREEELTHEGFVYANKIYIERKCELFEVKDIAHDFVQGAIYADQHPKKELWDAEKVTEWLENHAREFKYYDSDFADGNIDVEGLIETLTKAMEEEQ